MAHRDERKRSKHKRSKHKKQHKRHKHKKHHKKRRKKSKHHRRNRGKARPSGLPSVPTLEQNQYFMMQARVAGLEQQLLAAAKESKPEKSRAEEVDLLNQVLEEQDRQSRGRDRARGSTGLTPEEARGLVKLGAELSRSAPDSFGVEPMGGDDADSSSAERSAARASRSGSPSMWHSMTPVKTEPEPSGGDDPFEQARGQERESVARLTSGALEESTRP